MHKRRERLRNAREPWKVKALVSGSLKGTGLQRKTQTCRPSAQFSSKVVTQTPYVLKEGAGSAILRRKNLRRKQETKRYCSSKCHPGGLSGIQGAGHVATPGCWWLRALRTALRGAHCPTTERGDPVLGDSVSGLCFSAGKWQRWGLGPGLSDSGDVMRLHAECYTHFVCATGTHLTLAPLSLNIPIL